MVLVHTAYWFLPLTASGVAASAVAHYATLVGLAKGLAIEGNPFAIFLSMGRLGVPLTSSIIGAAYVLAWVVGQKQAGTKSDVLVWRAAVIGMTAFFLLDMLNDLAVIF
jgi:amino acid permease